MPAKPTVDASWTCKKCGYGANSSPPEGYPAVAKISWDPGKPNKITLQCVVCGFSEQVPDWDHS